MTLKVHYLCSYYSQFAHENLAPRGPSLWDAYMFSRTVKSNTINGYCTVPTSPHKIRIDANNIPEARRLFGTFINQVLKIHGLNPDYFVPAPSKDSYDTPNYRSYLMVCEALPSHRVTPCLRFTGRLTPASQGGRRGYEYLRPYLECNSQQPLGNVIIVDDIVTTGGTLLACHDVLSEAGADVLCAIVCAKTVNTLEAGFGIRSFDIGADAGTIDF